MITLRFLSEALVAQYDSSSSKSYKQMAFLVDMTSFTVTYLPVCLIRTFPSVETKLSGMRRGSYRRSMRIQRGANKIQRFDRFTSNHNLCLSIVQKKNYQTDMEFFFKSAVVKRSSIFTGIFFHSQQWHFYP